MAGQKEGWPVRRGRLRRLHRGRPGHPAGSKAGTRSLIEGRAAGRPATTSRRCSSWTWCGAASCVLRRFASMASGRDEAVGGLLVDFRGRKGRRRRGARPPRRWRRGEASPHTHAAAASRGDESVGTPRRRRRVVGKDARAPGSRAHRAEGTSHTRTQVDIFGEKRSSRTCPTKNDQYREKGPPPFPDLSRESSRSTTSVRTTRIFGEGTFRSTAVSTTTYCGRRGEFERDLDEESKWVAAKMKKVVRGGGRGRQKVFSVL